MIFGMRGSLRVDGNFKKFLKRIDKCFREIALISRIKVLAWIVDIA